MIAALVLLLSGPVAESERLAAEALQLAPARPAAARSSAGRALAATAEFDPIAFVKAGRKGEVVEDEFLAAREEYRRHRARLYEAMGEALFRSGNAPAARRYFGRAVLLDATSGGRARLARALTSEGRGREALDLLLGAHAALDGDGLAIASQAADLAGVPSLQAELDRARLASLELEPRPEFRDGPLSLPDRARLSTGELFRAASEGVTLVYVADPGCRTCSADLLDLKGIAAPGARVALFAAQPEQDAALRSVVTLYRHRWPFLVNAGNARERDWPAPAVVAFARGGFSLAVVRPPLGSGLRPVLDVLARNDVAESVPRPAWNHRPVARPAPVPAPALLASGLAPGEDEPAPEPFARAVAAFEAGRHAEALKLLEAVAAAEDAWLLAPEARFDRALCLAALGRRDEARRILLRIGDSRFQDAVDAALERVGTPRR